MTIAALAAILAAGCGKDGGEPAPGGEPAAAKPVETDPVKRRMNDPEYVAKLDALSKEQADLRGRVFRALRALDEAKERNAPEEEIAALQAAVDSAKAELGKNFAKSSATVAAQLRGDTEPAGAANTNEKEQLQK